MKVYSKTIHSFANKLHIMAKEVINKETEFSIARNRFIYNGYYYPLSIIIFEGEKIGYFDSKSYQIAINMQLLTESKDDVLKDILRHEIAHYITFIKYPTHTMAHGDEFLKVCDHYKWKNTAKSTIDIQVANQSPNSLKSEAIVRKVKKLMSLASSSNSYESQLATLKANQILIKHNLSRANLCDELIYTDIIHSQPKLNSKLSCIYEILGHFMVCPMLVNSKSVVTLEASGNKEIIELAHYLFTTLDKELDKLWLIEKEQYSLKGLKAKNSFFSGIARGYTNKVDELKHSFSPSDSRDLITVNASLDKIRSQIYPNLRNSYSKRSIDTSSFNLGKKAGSSLNIKKGIKNAKKILSIGN